MRLGTGTAGTAEAGVILIATEPGLQDELTVGQLRLVHAIPAGVPWLGGQCCKTTRERESGKEALCALKILTHHFISFKGKWHCDCQIPTKCSYSVTFQHLYVQLQGGITISTHSFFLIAVDIQYYSTGVQHSGYTFI